MKWFGPSVHVEVVDRQNEMQIRVTRQSRRIDFVVWAAFVAVFVFLFWWKQNWIYLFAVVGSIGCSILYWAGDGVAEMLITEKNVEVRGKLGGLSQETVRVSWSSISGLDYREGGEDEPSGLYARRGGRRYSLLVTSVNKEQTEELIAAIYRRFPYVEMAEDDGGWLPMGGKTGLTTLGLSEANRKRSDGDTAN